MFIGIDGCRKGWVAVTLASSGEPRIDLFSNLEDCFRGRLKSFRLALIDIPIGLKARGAEERLCEPLARIKLRQRRSSVFPAPVRAVLSQTADYSAASRISFKLTGKKISRQTWNICPKIREAEAFLCRRRSLIARVAESHPELCFASLNGGAPMAYSKRKRVGTCESGLNERLRILKKYWKRPQDAYPVFARRYPGTAKADDVLDAMVLAVSARLMIVRKAWCSLPEKPQVDDHGLPMRMVYPDPSKVRP